MANQPTNPQRADPIRDLFFVPLETIDNVSNWLFFFTALLSFLALLFDAKADPDGYNYVQTVFIATAVILFVFGQATKLYFWPRSERSRRQDFLSYGLGANLTHIRTTGYYNNNETDPIRRIGSAVLENTLFTKIIFRKMLTRVRLLTLGYFSASSLFPVISEWSGFARRLKISTRAFLPSFVPALHQLPWNPMFGRPSQSTRPQKRMRESSPLRRFSLISIQTCLPNGKKLSSLPTSFSDKTLSMFQRDNGRRRRTSAAMSAIRASLQWPLLAESSRQHC